MLSGEQGACFEGKLEGDCSGVEDGDRGVNGLDGIVVGGAAPLGLTGIGISDAFGNCGDDSRLVGLLAFDGLHFMNSIFGEDGETGGLREDVELVGDDLVAIAFRGSGVGILDAARGDVTGVVFVASFTGQTEAEVALGSNWRVVGTIAVLAGDRGQLSTTVDSEDVEDVFVVLGESSFEGLWAISSVLNVGSCSSATALELDATFAFLAGRVSVLGSAGSMERGNFGLGSVSGGVRRGGTLGL